ncbi:MAG: DUF1573 domain-containing protein [Planctomycetota bacterium]
MKPRMLALIVCGLALVLSAGLAYLTSRHAINLRKPLSLMPEHIDLGDVLEGEEKSVHLQLKNSGEQPVTVTKAAMSCGCASLMPTVDRQQKLPFVVAPAQSVSWELSVNTDNMIGRQKVGVVMQGVSEERTIQASSKVAMNILPGWRVYPSGLVFDDVEKTEGSQRELAVFDGYPDPGVKLLGVRPSCAERMTVTVIPASELSTDRRRVYESPVKRKKDASLLKLRYVVQVRCSVEKEEEALEEVILEGDESVCEDLHIPVVIRPKRPEYRVLPESLAIWLGSGEGSVVRELQVVASGSSAPLIGEINAPDFVSVKIGESTGNARKVRLEVSAPLDDVPLDTSVGLILETKVGNKVQLQVPIHIEMDKRRSQ